MLSVAFVFFILGNFSAQIEARVFLPLFGDINANLFNLRCRLDINASIARPQPLLVDVATETFVEPLPNGVIELEQGEVIEVICPDGFHKDSQITGTQIYAECLEDEIFIVNEEIYTFYEFKCKKSVTSTARRTQQGCGTGATLVEIGFESGDRFLSLFDVCHDEELEATLYVNHELSPSIVAYEAGVPRPQFVTGDFYNGKDVNFLYTKNQQKKTIGNILGYNVDQYFNESYNIYLARGHLAAKSDVIYASHQFATFYFINAAPQWQRFNGGNWERVESGVRNIVAARNIYVDCYTGTYGIMRLPDSNGHPKELYLSMDESGNGQIPVPMLYFRVVVQPETKLGIVLLGVNNPHLTYEELAAEYIICDDVSDLIDWIQWNKDDIPLGYSYACEVNSFLEVVDYLPRLDVIGLLV